MPPDFRFDTFTTAVIFLLIGMSVQPYALLLFEFWTTRPRKFEPRDPFDICGPECTIQK